MKNIKNVTVTRTRKYILTGENLLKWIETGDSNSHFCFNPTSSFFNSKHTNTEFSSSFRQTLHKRKLKSIFYKQTKKKSSLIFSSLSFKKTKALLQETILSNQHARQQQTKVFIKLFFNTAMHRRIDIHSCERWTQRLQTHVPSSNTPFARRIRFSIFSSLFKSSYNHHQRGRRREQQH